MIDKLINMNDGTFWGLIDALTNPITENVKRIQDSGFKKLINRPHNLINIKDKDGTVTGQRLELVTTPFKTEDIKVTVTDGILSVECGNDIKDCNEFEEIIYRGISKQSYSFQLKLADTIDQTKIKANNKDGILKIDLPLKKVEDKKPETIVINLK